MRILRFLIPVFVLGACGGVALWLLATRPEPELRPPPSAVAVVQAMRLEPVSYPVRIHTQGTVKPRTESTLKPQVSGQILAISPAFREGGFFEEGDWLVTIDPRDYETAVTVAEATLAQSESELELEKAQHAQALENWTQLGDGTEPSPLTLREPQLAEAKAKVASARARLDEARRNLVRTRIFAPFAGRIMRKQADVGQVVSPGNELATLFAVDYVEVRLPLRNEHLDFINLPEEYRGDDAVPASKPRVTLRGQVGSRAVAWPGAIIRAEGAYDSRTRELFVVAQVDDPYGRAAQERPPLKVGQFVEADIEGVVLTNVFVIPRTAIREGREVLVIDGENTVRRREVAVLWGDRTHVVVRDNLQAGEAVSITPLQFATDGTPVIPQFLGEAPPPSEPAATQTRHESGPPKPTPSS